MKIIFTLSLFLLFSVALKAQLPLQGVYTVGDNTSNFPTISQAINDLNAYGISGNVVFKIKSGKYNNEQFTIKNFIKDSAADSVIFESADSNADSVVIAFTGYPGHTYVMRLDHVSGVTFKKLTFKNDSPTNCLIVKLVNNNKNIHFERNNFIGPEISTSYNDSINLFLSQGQKDTNLYFVGNYFEGGVDALHFLGSSTATGLQIKENIFKKQRNVAVYIQLYNGNVMIHGNDIEMLSNGSVMGISLQNINSSVSVENNKVRMLQGKCISISGCYPSAGSFVDLFNNRLSMQNGICGISFQNSSDGKIINNTIYTHHNTNTQYAIAIDNAGNTAVENNLFVNDNGGSLIYLGTLTTGNSIDLNVYAGAFMGKVSGTDYTSLTTWYVDKGWDGQSVTIAVPAFVNNDFSELKLDCNPSIQLKRTRTTKAVVSYDFEGHAKTGGVVYVGADEYVWGNKAAYIKGFVLSGTDTVKSGKVLLYADVTNANKWDVIGNASIEEDGSYAIDGVTPANYIVQAIPNESDYANLIPAYQNGAFAWESVTGFFGDSCGVTNQNITVIEMVSLGSGNATISGYAYNDGTFKANDPIPGLDIILDKIPPSKSVQKTKTDANGYYEFNNLPVGHYRISVDVTGIGVDSLYELDIADPDSAYIKYDYCIESTINACYEYSAVASVKNKNSAVKIWPNPAENQLKIKLPESESSYNISIYDVFGKEVYAVAVGNTQLLEVDLTSVANGVYIVKVSSVDTITEIKLVKQ